MILHKDTKSFARLIAIVAEKYDINPQFIEKDYWITLILQRLSQSKYVDFAVFKGGTSLSKGYDLIFRFSEDVDIALCHTEEQSGNQIKTTIRTIEKEIASELTAVDKAGVTSKGSRFRKSVYSYASVLGKTVKYNSSVIVEINSFANPYPFAKQSIESFITRYLREVGDDESIAEFVLQPFELNVLDKRQTLIEKLVSLVRFSQLGVAGISSKIRHFYDLHFLLQDDECREYVESPRFKEEFDAILAHDKEMFADPKGWQDVAIKDIPLFSDTDRVWAELAPIYRNELSGLAFEEIPAEDNVVASFKVIADRVIR
ncbi:MAG: nucleotidyl transferase AbiEii/AbiGii toxin family protein [Rikenellaceae bacterium]